MGGSILGAEAIYQFLKHKIKKNFFFLNNLEKKFNLLKKEKDIVNFEKEILEKFNYLLEIENLSNKI